MIIIIIIMPWLMALLTACWKTEKWKRTWWRPSRKNNLFAITEQRKGQPPYSLRPRTEKIIYEKRRSRGSQIGFKSLPFWILQVFSTIAIYTWPSFSTSFIPQLISLHSIPQHYQSQTDVRNQCPSNEQANWCHSFPFCQQTRKSWLHPPTDYAPSPLWLAFFWSGQHI